MGKLSGLPATVELPDGDGALLDNPDGAGDCGWGAAGAAAAGKAAAVHCSSCVTCSKLPCSWNSCRLARLRLMAAPTCMQAPPHWTPVREVGGFGR